MEVNEKCTAAIGSSRCMAGLRASEVCGGGVECHEAII